MSQELQAVGREIATYHAIAFLQTSLHKSRWRCIADMPYDRLQQREIAGARWAPRGAWYHKVAISYVESRMSEALRERCPQ